MRLQSYIVFAIGASLLAGCAPQPTTAPLDKGAVEARARAAEESDPTTAIRLYRDLADASTGRERVGYLLEGAELLVARQDTAAAERWLEEAAAGASQEQQNFILTQIPDPQLPEVIARVAAVGFPLDTNRLRATSIACTGETFCNFSVTPTKSKLAEIIEHLEKTFGRAVEDLKINLDGCPHACAHHWTGDIGLH